MGWPHSGCGPHQGQEELLSPPCGRRICQGKGHNRELAEEDRDTELPRDPSTGRSSLKSLVRVDTHVGGSRTVRAGSWWTAPAGPGPARPPRFGGAAPPAPSRPGGPGWAAPAPHADTCGRAGRTGGTHSGPGAPRCRHARDT